MRRYPIGDGTLAPRVPREFAALMSALAIRGASCDQLLELDEPEWRSLLDLADLAHLTLPLAEAVSPEFPAWVVRRLETNVADNAGRSARICTVYLEAAEALRRARIPHLVLKGFSQVPEFVPNVRFRAQSDIDLYCPPGLIADAQRALEEIGYSAEARDFRWSDHLPALVRRGDWRWAGNFYDPEMPPAIELHFCLWNERIVLSDVPDTSPFWERRVVRQIDGIAYPGLCPADQLGYLALHILRGALTQDWIVNHVHELAYFLDSHSSDERFWAEWLELHPESLRSLEAIAFALARAWFSPQLHPRVRAGIDALSRPVASWLEACGVSPLEVMFQPNKDGRWLQLLLTRSPGGRRAILREAFVPRIPEGGAGTATRFRNRRPVVPVFRNRILAYLEYVGDRALSTLRANTSFLAHGARLEIAQPSNPIGFLLFLAGSIFLVGPLFSLTAPGSR